MCHPPHTLSIVLSLLRFGTTQFDAGSQVSTGAEIASHPLTAGITSFNYGAAVEVSGGTSLFFSHGGIAYAQVEATTPTPTPEPATLGLFGMGIAWLGFMRRRRST